MIKKDNNNGTSICGKNAIKFKIIYLLSNVNFHCRNIMK